MVYTGPALEVGASSPQHQVLVLAVEWGDAGVGIAADVLGLVGNPVSRGILPPVGHR